MAHITQIWIYPIKSCQGISLTHSSIDERGLTWDRRWVLVDAQGVFLTQRSTRVLGEFLPEIAEGGFWVTHQPSQEKCWLPLMPQTTEEKEIHIWDDAVRCIRVDHALDRWFSEKMQQEVSLFFQPDDAVRPIEFEYQVSGNEHTSLSDGYPILVLSEASVEKISQEAGSLMHVLRFRPNIVLGGMEAFEEDHLGAFRVGSTVLKSVKPCARCVLTTVDPLTLLTGPEPLKSLARYRKQGQKIWVGQNTLVHEIGSIQLNDVVISLKA